MIPKKRLAIMLMVIIFAMVTFAPAVLADTDGNEIQIADQPDKLILQLGPEWIGVEFELKTDAGVFPASVVVDSNGILKMDLGGSKTYTLSCLSSSVTVPGPGQEQAELPETDSPEATTPIDDDKPDSAQSTEGGIPTGILVMFIGGLVAAAGGLIVMRYLKHRRESYVYDDDEDEYE